MILTRFRSACAIAMLVIFFQCGSHCARAQSAPASEMPAGFETADADGFEPVAPQPIGRGDEHIWVIPSISAPSVKNGGKISFSAVVKAAAGVEKIEATIREAEGDAPRTIDTLALAPSDSKLGGVALGGTLGLWTAEWTGRNLEEKPYRVTLTITDRAGHTFTDDSLTFTDPVAGVTAPGTTAYPNAALRQMGALTLNAGENQFLCAAIDPAAGYAYFGTNTSPGRVVKVALGGAGAPTRVGALTLNAGENQLLCAAIDPAAGYGYFGTYTSPGIVVKVALGGAGAPTRVGAVTLNTGENALYSAVIDPAAGHAYFGTLTAPGIVVKVTLGGAGAPTRVGALTLNPGEDKLDSAEIDPAAGYAYFGTNTFPGRVVKVALGGAGAPTRVGALTLNAGEDQLPSAAIDSAAGYAYFGTFTSPGRVVKVALGGAGAPTRAGALTLNTGEDYFYSVAIDPAAGYAYFSASIVPGIVVKVGISENGQLKATDMTMPELGIISDVNFYSHAAKGNARLAIYDDAAPRNKLWESGSVANGVAGGFLSVPISSGAPSSLTLPAGNYQLAWQVDTNADVPSYALGAANEGLAIERPYGAFPSDLDSLSPTSTDERWTMYVNYSVPTPSPTPSPTASQTATPTASQTASSTPSPTASPTASQTTTPTASQTTTPTASQTATPTASQTATPTASQTATPSETPSPTPSTTPSPTASPTASAAGDWAQYE